jgi:hypothetical protein
MDKQDVHPPKMRVAWKLPYHFLFEWGIPLKRLTWLGWYRLVTAFSMTMDKGRSRWDYGGGVG